LCGLKNSRGGRSRTEANWGLKIRFIAVFRVTRDFNHWDARSSRKMERPGIIANEQTTLLEQRASFP
jgi:hypothetical protein